MIRRCKLGVLVPSSNITMEYELYKMAPDGVSIHFSRIPQTEDTEEQLAAMIDYVPQAAELLAHARVDAIAFGCTSGSFIKGVGYDKQIIESIQQNTGIPATTTTTAVLEALDLMGLKKISVGAPYTDPIMQKLKKLLEENGFKITKIKGLGLLKGEGDLPIDETYKLVREIDTPESDGIFISCTDFKTVEILELLEEDLGKPVVSSNQATMWKLLRLSGLKTKIRGFGALLREF
ncbi:aspartate/glutamate racemase family protein [Thermococcus aggregans]|uniref:Aspartate/glutamate racemase family protein n=1 Tax=Thermococcus aggregans TaxID=110163 RepID=A0A9E7SN07_THEAG|nr:aspartate/glutamate racemase family protein [Thermococcus aggregans]USS40046.1 aspartate/glutamate racemase family protein [Thermococcus aggregans]